MAGVGLPPSRAVVAEDIRGLQNRAAHVSRASGGRPHLLELTAIGSSGLITCWIVLVATRV
jgi:hypothetical protein